MAGKENEGSMLMRSEREWGDNDEEALQLTNKTGQDSRC